MTTKEEYEDAIKKIREAFYSAICEEWEIEQIAVNLDFLSSFINDNFKENYETNFEHYKDKIISVGSDFAVRNEEVVPCKGCRCLECCFNGGNFSCCTKRMNWLYQKYEKKYKLTQFEYDLLQHFSVDFKLKEIGLLKEMKEKGHFKNINGDELIKDILANCEVIK